MWNTLIHNGFLLNYKEYVPSIKTLEYKNKYYDISSLCELCLVLYANTKNETKDNIFQHNFISSIKSILPKGVNDIKNINLKKFSITPKFKVFPRTFIEQHKFALIDGNKVELNSFHAEPTHIFIGKGCHPMRGTVKFEPRNKDIVMNLSKNVSLNTNIYKNVVSFNHVNWLAYYKDSLGKYKYIYPKQNTSNDFEKFENARKLSKKLTKIRKLNENYLSSDSKKKQQLGCCVWLIDKLSLRVGNEKDEYEAETYGVCTLLVKHMKIQNDKLIVKFLGKDSIHCTKQCTLTPVTYNLFAQMMTKQSENSQVFDIVDAASVNRYLNKLMPGLTAKVFRTTNASRKFCSLLRNKPTGEDPIKYFKMCNQKIAIICNHKTNNTLSTSTSKANYIDPRIIFSYSLREKVDINKLLSDTLIQKYQWASDVDEYFKF